MTRLQADCLLLITAIIWGTAFVAQKTGMNGLGALGFVGVRFSLSLAVIMPFVLMERSKAPALPSGWWKGCVALSIFFIGGVVLQQIGISHTSVTNAGFLTGMGVVFVPFIAWVLFRRRPSWTVIPTCLIAVMGLWFLNGGSLARIGWGDGLVLMCSVFFAAQVALMGFLLGRIKRPLLFSAIQYAACALAGLSLALHYEGITWQALLDNIGPLFYAGAVSGGIAYTLQAVAQQHTPPADAAIIMSGEALFAALAGAFILGDRLGVMGWLGCALILLAMLLVEAGSLYTARRKVSETK
ncbi:MAG: DMT family transporter [Micavibrio aeruginosavorus]|uniref:DMT family transporter n=1 Tax=Micavibrio aeruginosavorus TaxID=349221 RepID=A0A7T5UIA3_9BACT|nr:MAG: DMT family transporter [Micavibrio aeruginosavorus]